MASPEFNAQKIFDSDDGSGGTFSEGCLALDAYTAIRQRIHFNGEDGDRYLTHGWPDRAWTFKGYIYAGSDTDLMNKFRAIQDYIDEAVTDGTYRVLIDSFGQTFSAAQIHSMTSPDIRATEDGGYCSPVVVKGIAQGMVEDGSGGE